MAVSFVCGLRKQNDTSGERQCLSQTGWFIVNEESFLALQAQAGCPWSASPSEVRGEFWQMAVAFQFLKDKRCGAENYFISVHIHFCLSLEYAASEHLDFLVLLLWKCLVNKIKASGTCCLLPIQIAEDAGFNVLQVLRKSTEPPFALAVCISLFNIISAVIKWPGH